MITEDHSWKSWAAAPGSPQQVPVVLCVGCDQLPGGVHKVYRQDVRASDPPTALIPALSADQEVAANCDGRKALIPRGGAVRLSCSGDNGGDSALVANAVSLTTI